MLCALSSSPGTSIPAGCCDRPRAGIRNVAAALASSLICLFQRRATGARSSATDDGHQPAHQLSRVALGGVLDRGRPPGGSAACERLHGRHRAGDDLILMVGMRPSRRTAPAAGQRRIPPRRAAGPGASNFQTGTLACLGASRPTPRPCRWPRAVHPAFSAVLERIERLFGVAGMRRGRSPASRRPWRRRAAHNRGGRITGTGQSRAIGGQQVRADGRAAHTADDHARDFRSLRHFGSASYWAAEVPGPVPRRGANWSGRPSSSPRMFCASSFSMSERSSRFMMLHSYSGGDAFVDLTPLPAGLLRQPGCQPAR